MKTFAPVLAALAFLSLSFSSCLGPKVDSVALFEPAALAWPAVEEDVLRGIAAIEKESLDREAAEGGEPLPAAVAANIADGRYYCSEMGAALLSKDRSRLRVVPWPQLQGLASVGIGAALTAEEIGPGVAESLRGQLSRFSAVILKLQEP